jgi:hypothetical protein
MPLSAVLERCKKCVRLVTSDVTSFRSHFDLKGYSGAQGAEVYFEPAFFLSSRDKTSISSSFKMSSNVQAMRSPQTVEPGRSPRCSSVMGITTIS